MPSPSPQDKTCKKENTPTIQHQANLMPLNVSAFEKAFKTQILRPLTNNENYTLPLMNLRPILYNVLLSTTTCTPPQQDQQQYEEAIIDILRHKYIPQVIQCCLSYNGSTDDEILWVSHILQSFVEVSVIWMKEHGLDYLGGDWWDALYKCIGDGFYDDTLENVNGRKNCVLPR